MNKEGSPFPVRTDRDTAADGSDGEHKGVKAIVVVPVLAGPAGRHSDPGLETQPQITRSGSARLEEAMGLAHAIDLDVVHTRIITVSKPRPSTLFGKGIVEDITAITTTEAIELVIVDQPLSPVQQRNLERSFKTKVLDRTGLILEIFGRRAQTREGVLQVELAHLNYQRGRLVRSWTHLERQRGGAGFLGGPGETQIEADRRILQARIQKLKRELETVRRTRDLHRSKRRKVPYPVVSIVGYTNAGKSTLFNRLTGAGVMAEDMLFATLDPTLRRVCLPHGTEIILSDTVGFISDLPTHLVAAFRATLEEVIEADLIIHLRDISDPDTAAQAQDVEKILNDLGVDNHDGKQILEVWNKADRLAGEELATTIEGEGRKADTGSKPLHISALNGQGIEPLLHQIESRISGLLVTISVRLKVEELKHLDWIYRNAQVLERKDNDDGTIELDLRVATSKRGAIEARASILPS